MRKEKISIPGFSRHLGNMDLNPSQISFLKKLKEKDYKYIHNERFSNPKAHFPDPFPNYTPPADWINRIFSFVPNENKASVPKLTRLQEKQIFLRYNYFKYRIRQKQIKLKDKIANKDDILLLLKYHKIVSQLEDKIITLNMGIVLMVCGYSEFDERKDVSISDYRSECSISLLNTVRAFNAELGFKFSSYFCRSAVNFLRRYSRRSNRKFNKVISLDEAIYNNSKTKETINLDYKDKLNSIVSNKQIYKSLGFNEKEISILYHNFLTPYGLGLNLEQLTNIIQANHPLWQMSLSTVTRLRRTAIKKVKNNIPVYPDEKKSISSTDSSLVCNR